MADYPHVTAILQSASLFNYSDVPKNIMEFAANRGSIGHETCALYDLNNLRMDTIDLRIRPYLDAWIKFRKETGAVIEAIEQRVISDKYHYQGTLDRIAVISGKRGPLEIKLTASLMPSTAYQTAAYLQAWNEEQRTVNPKYRKLATTRYAVRLKDDGTYELPPKNFFRPNDWNVFMAALVICNAKKERKI